MTTTLRPGTPVKLRRGSSRVAPGTKGCSREVKARIVGKTEAGEYLAQLTQDDPLDAVGWSRVGNIGHWPASAITKDNDNDDKR